MNEIVVNTGDVVVSDFGVYQHWSIVTDKLCSKGLPLLISATKRNGTVQEEPWEVVTNGKHTYVANIKYDRPVQEVLKLARSQIGSWKYSLIDNNCEHFAKWATGLDVSSTQVIAGASGALAGVAIIGTFSENPKFAKFLGGIVLIGGLAILATKAVEKK